MKEGKIMRNFKIMISIFMLAVSFASMSAAKKSTVRKTSGKKTTVKKVVKKENENSLLFNLNSQKIIHMKHTNLVKLNLSEISAKNKICIIKHNINF